MFVDLSSDKDVISNIFYKNKQIELIENQIRYNLETKSNRAYVNFFIV